MLVSILNCLDLGRITYKLLFLVFYMGFWIIVGRVLKASDVVIFVIDARMPELSRNVRLEEMVGRFRKPLITVFTKIDLISEKALADLKSKHKDAYFVSGIKNEGIKELRKRLFIDGKKMGYPEPRVGVVGYPNVGKSAIINALAYRAKAHISIKAGTTRGVQYVKAGILKILDSPGVVPFADKEAKLALIAAKNPEKLRWPTKVAAEIVKLFETQNKELFEKYVGFKITEGMEPEEILEKYGRRRGFLSKGGIVDETKSAITLIRDWQKGKLRL